CGSPLVTTERSQSQGTTAGGYERAAMIPEGPSAKGRPPGPSPLAPSHQPTWQSAYRAVAESVRHEFRRLPFSSLVPLRAWWMDQDWRRGRMALFLVAALAPFVLLHATASGSSEDSTAWGFALYFALIWLIA